jgi:N-acetylneuraminic acid mutarotase
MITTIRAFILSLLPALSVWSQDGILAITNNAGELILSWSGSGTPQSATELAGPWQDLPGKGSPLTVSATNRQQFFRVIHRWETRAPLLEANSEMGVAELAGRIYVLGGYPSSRVTVTTVQVYDPESNQWSLTTPLPIPLNHPMPAVANQRLYMIGGQTNANNSGSFVSTVFEFDPLTIQWTNRAPMPTARSAGAAAAIGNLIYVAGGRPPRGNDFAVYDTENDLWTPLPDLPTARNHLAACAIDGRIYVAGGRLGAGFTSPMTAVLEVFDPALGTWTTRAPMPTVRGGINGIAVNDCFFVFGGEGPEGVFEQMEVYSATTDRWRSLEPLPVPVHGVTGAAFIDGYIHLPGGGTSTGGSSGSTLHQVFLVEGICP